MMDFKNYMMSFFSVPEDKSELITSFFEPATIRKNGYLVAEGKVCRYLSFIESGVARYKKYEQDGSETTCFFMAENDFIGDPESFLSRMPSKLNAQAITDMKVVRISQTQAEALNKIYPAIADAYSKIDHMVMMNLLDQRDFLMNKDADTRYRIFIEKFSNIHNRIPLQYIASFLEIAQPSLSRLRRQMT
jgi:CRP-like cAMP-binding protein